MAISTIDSEGQASAQSRPASSIKVLYGTIIFLGAFLLFQVEPIIAKLILPWFGGAAAVWSVCLLFFQVVLLAGYSYAHLLSRVFRPQVQRAIHIGLLTLSCLILPILPRTSFAPSGSEDPAFRVLLVLAVTVGFPFFLLSSTSPLLQTWLSKSHAGAVPYRLFALSNAGSLLALVSYPVLVEPRMSSHRQAIFWSVAYSTLVVLCAAMALLARGTDSGVAADRSQPVPGWKLKCLWAALAACGSALLLSITNHISQNIAAIPLLWIVPLSLYLLTFVLGFEGHNLYRRGFALRFVAVLLGGMAYALTPNRANLPPYVLVPLYCIGLFACCFVCHGELARLKPHPAYLTSYYLALSAGGAAGALFVGLLAPRVFRGYYELPISLGLCSVLILLALYEDRDLVLSSPIAKRIFAISVVLVVAFCVSLYRTASSQLAQARVVVRNFYGVLRVEDRAAPGVVLLSGGATQVLDPDPRYRDLINGTIEHGVQFIAAARRQQTTTYYTPRSGIGMALRVAGRQGAIKVGMIGLGAGTIAAYGRPGDQYVFYEINPLVVTLAQNQFSFLKMSGAQIEIIPGDGRWSLERQANQQFDVLGVDAFSSDAIPVHLLTREAFALYLRHIKPTGVLALHVSNKYLDLAPIVCATAASLQLKSVTVTNSADESQLTYAATWILVGKDGGLIEQPDFASADQSQTVLADKIWTDDYSSILPTLK